MTDRDVIIMQLSDAEILLWRENFGYWPPHLAKQPQRMQQIEWVWNGWLRERTRDRPMKLAAESRQAS